MDRAKMVLRYFIHPDEAKERFSLLKRFLKKTGIRRVLLFTGCFMEEKTVMPLEYYERHAATLQKYIPELREMGVEIGINVLTTMGHVFFGDDPADRDFRRAVDTNGNVSNGSICPREQKLHEYAAKIYSCYAALYPDVIFMDDDIRNIKMGNMVCFCDEHLAAIAKEYGEPVTREEVRAALLSDQVGGDRLKQTEIEIFRQDIASLTRTIYDAIKKVSPKTELGAMTVEYPSAAFDRFLPALGESGVTRVRTGMNFYREGVTKEMPGAFASPMIQRNLIGKQQIEIQPELENDPYSLFYNSLAKTHLQVVWCLTNGLRNIQLNLFDMLGVPDDFEAFTRLFAEKRRYYDALAALIPEGSRAQGVYIPANADTLLYKRAKDEASLEELLRPNDWYQWLALDGIPIGYDAQSPFVFLSGDDVCGDREEIGRLLQRGAVIDLSAAECLVQMGFGKRIGISQISPIRRAFAGEIFTDHAANGKYAGMHNSYYFHSGLLKNSEVADIRYEGKAEELSVIVDDKHKKLASGVVLTENEAGEKFCILPYDEGLFQQFTNVNYRRKQQLCGAMAHIFGQELPVVSLRANVCVNFNRFDDYNVIALFNFNHDSVSKAALQYAPKNELYLLTDKGTLKKASVVQRNGQEEVKVDLAALGCAVLVDCTAQREAMWNEKADNRA